MSRAMRLGINARFLAAPITGVQRFAHEVVRRIALETDVTLFVPRGVQVPHDMRGVVVGGRLRGHSWEQLELPGAIGGCDVMLHPANTAPVRAAIPSVLVLHDVLPLTDPAWFAPSFARWQRLVTPRAARAAARIVTVSDWSRRTICDSTGVPSSRVLVTAQGLSPFDAPASAAAVERTRHQFRLPARYLLAVGGDTRKNIGFLIGMLEEWQALHGTAPALVVVGSARQRVHGAPRVDGDRANVDVRALGRVTDEQLHALYTGALALCSPSLSEGFGRPPLEAIACVTPSVAAPYAAAGETLRGLASARVVPLSVAGWIDALRAIEQLPRTQLLADAASVRERWTWTAAADTVLHACTSALQDSHEPRASRSRPIAVRPPAAVGVAPLRTPGAEPRRASAARPRVALVHDWLTGLRGGERVLEALVEMLPGADVFTLIHVPGTAPRAVEELRIRTSFVDALPGVRHYYRYCLPLFPAAIERLDLSGYDLVVSSSHCVAKAVRPRGAPHLCYCHTPMRYIRDQSDAYLGTGTVGAALRRAALAPATRWLRRWDAATADRVDAFVANSEHVQRRIRKYYDRDAQVVHPPVSIERFAPAREREDVYVCAGALVPYKRIDLAIAAFNRSGRPLLVVGDGPAYRSLRRSARANVTFTGRVPDEDMAAILGCARALIMPMVEDFGIIAVEAQAAGAPVIAYGAGGALETVVPGVTGVFFQRQTSAAMNDAVERFERLEFDTLAMRRNAERFSVHAFHAGMRAALAGMSGGVAASGAARDPEPQAVGSCT